MTTKQMEEHYAKYIRLYGTDKTAEKLVTYIAFIRSLVKALTIADKNDFCSARSQGDNEYINVRKQIKDVLCAILGNDDAILEYARYCRERADEDQWYKDEACFMYRQYVRAKKQEQHSVEFQEAVEYLKTEDDFDDQEQKNLDMLALREFLPQA